MQRINSNERTECSRLLNANIKLSDTIEELKRDIFILINYIKGNKELENHVQEILEYYSSKNIK